MPKEGKYSTQAILEILKELGGSATVEDMFKRAREKGLPHDRTHVWDRLVNLSRSGKVLKDGDVWRIRP